MKRKLLTPFAVGAMALVMSSCFFVTSFTIVDYTLDIGQTTKARFTLRPSFEAEGSWLRAYQFVLVGVSDSDAVAVGKAVWGTNGKFNGPLTMSVNGAIDDSIGSQCSSNGLNFNEITGMTWKGYLTPQKVNDRGLVEQRAIVEVNVKPKADASTGSAYQVMGIAGAWIDDGDDIVNAGDTFICWGFGTSALYVKT